MYFRCESTAKLLRELPEGELVVPIQVKMSGGDVWVEVSYDSIYDRKMRKLLDCKGWLLNPSMHESTEEELYGDSK